MPRYITHPTAQADCDWWINDRPDVPMVDERRPVNTGLLDAHGKPIFRMPNPIGFGRDDEW